MYKKVSGSNIIFLILYIDDILLMGSNISLLDELKEWLSRKFSMKDLREAAYILGIKIYRDRSMRLLGLSQSIYITKVLKLFSIEKSKKGFLPMLHGVHLSKDMYPKTQIGREHIDKILYSSAIGSIIYAMLCIWSDVSDTLSIMSRYHVDPSEKH